MTALPVHCPSITSIQGPSVLSSEKNNHNFWIFFIKCEIFGLYPFCNCLLYKGFLVDRAPLSYFCCPSGHTQYPATQEKYNYISMKTNIFAGNKSQEIHNILLLRKSTTTFLWKQTSKFFKKNTKNLRTYTIFRCLQNFFRAPEVPFFLFSPIHSPNWQS